MQHGRNMKWEKSSRSASDFGILGGTYSDERGIR
jgi:hypothetical protein